MRIGVDFGGTKIEAAALDAEGRMRARLRAPNPGSYRDALAALAALVGQVEEKAGEKARVIGIGMPGSLSPVSGLVRNSNSVWLNGQPFFDDVRQILDRPVRVANDANCFALSEAVDGAGRGAGVVFGVILGTGCGGGLVVDGRLIEGVNAISGEWGHIPLPWPSAAECAGPRCWCGRPLCLETWVSGSGLARWGSGIMGRRMRAEEIVAAAQTGDATALRCMDLHADRLARALAVVIDIVDPEVVVLGGGLSNVASLYEAVVAKLPPYVFSDVIKTRVVKNVHGDSSGVRGAAWLFAATEAQ